jgi:hypothetical protein
MTLPPNGQQRCRGERKERGERPAVRCFQELRCVRHGCRLRQ